MKIECKIESLIGVNFKKLLTKMMNLIFKYILSVKFIKFGRRCSSDPPFKKKHLNNKQCKRIGSFHVWERHFFLFFL